MDDRIRKCVDCRHFHAESEACEPPTLEELAEEQCRHMQRWLTRRRVALAGQQHSQRPV